MSAYDGLNVDQTQSEEKRMNSCQGAGPTGTPESTESRTLHSGEIIKAKQVFSAEVSDRPDL